jgi:tetratricopeptide (TPR) repeat protein
LMKHAAAYGEGFTPCSLGPSIGMPPLQVSLPDARLALEQAHVQVNGRALGRGLELAQEAASLYQRVTDNAAHPGALESMELMASIFLEAGDPALAATNAEKNLGLAIQNGGFDTPGVFNAHMALFQMLFAANEFDRSVKHLRAATYLLEIMGGPHHMELFTAYHRLATVYQQPEYNGKYLSTSLKFFEEANRREPCDRLMQGFTTKSVAKTLAELGRYKEALEQEKRAYRTLSLLAGKDHEVTKTSDRDLQLYAKLAVEKGRKEVESDKMREEVTAITEGPLAEMLAEEEKAEEKKKLENMKKKKNKK